MLRTRVIGSKTLRYLRFLVVVWFLFGLVRDARAQGDFQPTEADQRAAKEISEPLLRSHIRFLADDLLEGRGPASHGDALAQLYLTTQLEGMGLRPAGTQGWRQPVPLIGITTKAPATITFAGGQGDETFRYYDEYIATGGKPEPKLSLQDKEVVFVGYGIQAPEYQWDDFKGMDLKGKILLMMNNDPAEDPQLFEGKRRLYYGRWDYKFESAARQGAAGAIIIHTTESAGYPFSVIQTSWTGEEFELRETQGPRLDAKIWMSDEAAIRLVQSSGNDLNALRKAAQSRDFRPVSLGKRLTMELECTVRKQDTANLLAVLPGSDPRLRDEHVIYMAHHDHIGMAAERTASGDMIYNGAIDNASGAATLLSIAAAYASLKEPPKRSILFALVAAEEQGLLGSKYFAENPTIAPGAMAAVINIDGIPFLGKTLDVNVIGGGKSDLDAVLERVTKWQKRVLTQDHFPDRGYYYRSDQFSLAKIGVPAVYLHSGMEIVGKPEGWGKQQLEEWVEKHYHQPSDEYRADWDLSGAVEDGQLLYYVGRIISEAPNMPQWKPGDEFEAARKKALSAR